MSDFPSIRPLVVMLACAAAIMALGAGRASAQPGIAYAATPPTHGALYSDGPTDRWLLGGTWLYRADPTDAGVAAGWWRNAASTDGWAAVSLPNSFNAGDLSAASMWGSVGWYRRDFTIPGNAFARYVPKADRSWSIEFDSVNYYATVWLNGHKLGTHAGAYLPFSLALKRWVRSGVNRLIVRVDDRRTPSSLPPGPSGGWWNFGGINQEVYLRSIQRADMSPVVIRPSLPCPTCAATVAEQVTVTNTTGRAESVILRGAYGAAKLNFGAHTISPGRTWVATASLRIRHPRLWAPGSPNLYHATLTLSDDQGRTLDGYRYESGIRSISVDPAGEVLVNGRVINARGFDLHQMSVGTGDAMSPAQLAGLVGWVRELGGTIIRAHYPLNPEIDQMADADGILLWSEIPVYQTASTYLTRPGWVTFAHNYLRANILTNEDHPSILLWSIGNELTTPPDGNEARYIAGAAQLAHQLDPTRPVGMAISAWPGVACQSAYAPLNVIGFNDYFGWFDAGGGSTDDADGLSPFLDGLHACYPNKAMMITEFGFEGNRNGPVEERGTYQFSAAAAASHLGVFASKPYISGAMWFALQNFPAKPGWTGGNPLGDPPFVEKGEIDLAGNPVEPLFDTVQSIYRATQQLGPAARVARRVRVAKTVRRTRPAGRLRPVS